MAASEAKPGDSLPSSGGGGATPAVAQAGGDPSAAAKAPTAVAPVAETNTKPAEAKKDAPQEAKVSESAPVASAEAHVASSAPAKKKFDPKILFSFLKVGSKGVGEIVLAPVKAILSVPLFIFKGDLSTKLVALCFLSGIFILGVATTRIYHRFLEPLMHKSGKTASSDGFNEMIEKQKELQIEASKVLFLKRFSASIASKSGKLRLVDFDLFVECSDGDAKKQIQSRFDAFRESVLNAIQGQTYESLLTEEGKNSLREKIRSSLNQMLRHLNLKGQVDRVFFSRFIMA